MIKNRNSGNELHFLQSVYNSLVIPYALCNKTKAVIRFCNCGIFMHLWNGLLRATNT